MGSCSCKINIRIFFTETGRIFFLLSVFVIVVLFLGMIYRFRFRVCDRKNVSNGPPPLPVSFTLQ